MGRFWLPQFHRFGLTRAVMPKLYWCNLVSGLGLAVEAGQRASSMVMSWGGDGFEGLKGYGGRCYDGDRRMARRGCGSGVWMLL